MWLYVWLQGGHFIDRIKLEDSVGRLETLLELKWKLDEVIDITSKRELEQFITADRMLLTYMQGKTDLIIKLRSYELKKLIALKWAKMAQ